MKEFNLEEAKAGKPICTRDGCKARIICWDRQGSPFPIVALIVDNNGFEEIHPFTIDGKISRYVNRSYDLMIASEKYEGWVNIYNHIGTPNPGRIFKTKAEALREGKDTPGYKATTKIEWEE